MVTSACNVRRKGSTSTSNGVFGAKVLVEHCLWIEGIKASAGRGVHGVIGYAVGHLAVAPVGLIDESFEVQLTSEEGSDVRRTLK